jgi:hypothetical protein
LIVDYLVAVVLAQVQSLWRMFSGNPPNDREEIWSLCSCFENMILPPVRRELFVLKSAPGV